MIEIIIIALLTAWTVFALCSLKKHKVCCGDCAECACVCHKKPPVR